MPSNAVAWKNKMGKSYRVRISNVIPCCLMRVPDDAAASTKLLYWGTLGKRDEVCGILITGAQSAVCVSPSLLPLLSHIPHSLHSPPPLSKIRAHACHVGCVCHSPSFYPLWSFSLLGTHFRLSSTPPSQVGHCVTYVYKMACCWHFLTCTQRKLVCG